MSNPVDHHMRSPLVPEHKSASGIHRRQFIAGTSGIISLLGLANNLNAKEESNNSPTRSVDALTKLTDAWALKDPPQVRFPARDGAFLSLLVKAARPQRVLEIGTSHGYASTWISNALSVSGGKLTTIEILPERVVKAKEHLAQTGLIDRVTFLEGNAHDIVPTLDQTFDLVYLNADKSGTLDYFQKLHPKKLAPHGLIVAYSAILMRDSLKDYLDLMLHNPEFDSLVLSVTMEDGFSISYRR
jgi:predicted O-methyltransferase YrrM